MSKVDLKGKRSMSLLRRTAQLLVMLACVSLSAWAIGCGGDSEAGSALRDGAGIDPTSTSDGDADSTVESE